MFWLQKTEFLLNQLWEHVDFQVIAAFDVVAAPGWSSERELQTWTELWLIREGRCDIVQGDKQATAAAGDAVLLRPDLPRLTTNAGETPLSIIGFSCAVRLAGDIDLLALLDLPLRMRPDVPKLQTLLESMVEESKTQRFGYTFALHGLAQMALVEVLRANGDFEDKRLALYATEKLQSKLSSEIMDVLHFIETHFGDEIMVAEMAAIAHLSPKHFSRRFKSAMGQAPMEFLLSFRLQRAAQRLTAHEEAIALTAAKCGFADATSFSRAFKRRFKLTPLAYRQHFQAMKVKGDLF